MQVFQAVNLKLSGIEGTLQLWTSIPPKCVFVAVSPKVY